ncbi:MAG: ABC transporter ATP-binding protein [Calditrichia bacterium]
MSTEIDIRRIQKNYGATPALKGISLSVERGEIFGLIGPDGAGKTTLMRLMCTLLQPDEGEIFIAGKNIFQHVAEIRAILGYMPQRFSLYQDLSVEQNLHFFARVFQVPQSELPQRLEKLYHFSRLGPFKNRKAGALSGGMKQKLALSCALIHTPRLLILDEPTFGVDPVSRQEFWEILKQIQLEGTTIFVSTAYMDEAELCDRISLIHRGQILQTGTPEEITSAYPFAIFRVTGENLQKLRAFFLGLPEVAATEMFGSELHVSFQTTPPKESWKQWQAQLAGLLNNYQPIRPRVEDVFMHLMGGNEDVA